MEFHRFCESKAEPANTNEPVLIGVLVTVTGVLENIVIGESAIRAYVQLLFLWAC